GARNDPGPSRMTPPGHIEAWRQDDGYWRWRYRGADGTDLLSNESYPDRQAAAHAAATAYPGVGVARVRTPGSPGRAVLRRVATITLLVWLARRLTGGLRVVFRARSLLRMTRRRS